MIYNSFTYINYILQKKNIIIYLICLFLAINLNEIITINYAEGFIDSIFKSSINLLGYSPQATSNEIVNEVMSPNINRDSVYVVWTEHPRLATINSEINYRR